MKFVRLIVASALSVVSLAAYAADLPAKPTSASAPLTSKPGFDWSGFYIGANAGHSFANMHDEIYDGYYGNKLSGLSAGGQIGYNVVVNKVVFGVEAEGDFDGVKGSNGNWDVAYHKNKSVSVLGRLGLDSGSFMPYVTAGFSAASLSDSLGDKTSRSGWTAGVGAEYVLADNLVGRIEYRFTDFGSIPNSGEWYQLHATDSTVRVGISYYFH